MQDYSVLIVGCDKHKKLLDRFFKQFIRYWTDYSINIYLSMEKEDYNYKGLKIIVTKYGTDWSLRVKKTIEQIPNSAVLLLLDDFIIECPVDHNELNKIARLIALDDGIAHFALTTVPMKNNSNHVFYDRYFYRYHFGRYKTTLQAGMWNKREILSVIRPGESAWSFETYANYRSYLSPRRYYAITKSDYKPIKYNDGLFCIRGKVNTLELMRLKKKFDEDFSIDGMEENRGIIIRDPCPFFKKLPRKAKTIFWDLVYRVRWLIKK